MSRSSPAVPPDGLHPVTGGPAPARPHVLAKRSASGGLGWLLLLPIACCAGPWIVAGLVAAGAWAWGGAGAALAVALAVVLLRLRFRRRRACRQPLRDARHTADAVDPAVRP